MNTPARIGGFVLGLGALFAAALGVGAAVGPTGSGDASTPEQHAGMAAGHSNAGHAESEHAESGHSGSMAGSHEPEGLAVSAQGFTFVPLRTRIGPRQDETFRFTITGPDGRPLRKYTPTHSKELHLIVVRRDGRDYQHLHPTRAADGTWSVPLRLPSAGDYRVFADFDPDGPAGPLTLGADVHAAGEFRPASTPAPSRLSTVDGYEVRLAGDLAAGRSSMVTVAVSRNGSPVTDLQPYLAAYGHLVALRVGDLAYLHVHPEGAPGDGTTRPGPRITFHAEVPTAGTYLLYLDFRHDGQVHTAQFTATAE